MKPCRLLLTSSPLQELKWIFDLIRENGKKEVLGRPNLYVTTDYFLDYMGINSLEELPVVEETELITEESQLFVERIEDENQ